MVVYFRRMGGLTTYPNLTALEVLLLPDRHYFLEPVDSEPACFERLGAMGRRNCNRHRGLADIHKTDPMRNRDAYYIPTLTRFLSQLAHLGERHRLISLVLQPQHVPPGVIATSRADECHNRPGGR